MTITGANLSGASAVQFGATAAVWFNVMSATSITAKAPAGSGTVDVRVTTTFGTSAANPADQFTYAAPTSRTLFFENDSLTLTAQSAADLRALLEHVHDEMAVEPAIVFIISRRVIIGRMLLFLEWAIRAFVPRRCQPRAVPSSTIWVCVTMASNLPCALVIRVCQTIVRRPRCTAAHSPVTVVPAGAGARKLVFDSMVVVVAPSGRLSIVA